MVLHHTDCLNLYKSCVLCPVTIWFMSCALVYRQITITGIPSMDCRPRFINSGAPGRGCAYRLLGEPDGNFFVNSLLKNEVSRSTLLIRSVCSSHIYYILIFLHVTIHGAASVMSHSGTPTPANLSTNASTTDYYVHSLHARLIVEAGNPLTEPNQQASS
jgi:hypothetical protein